MDQATIQEIARAVATASAPPWAELGLFIIFTGIVAGVGAYIGAYLKRKGENFATKEDFDSLVSQLQTNTKVVEEIRSEFGQRDWARREWATIRRAKLEELIDGLHACREYVEEGATLAARGESSIEPEQMSACNTLTTLYFPELAASVRAYTIKCHKHQRLNLDFAIRFLNLDSGDQFAELATAFDTERSPIYQDVLALLSAVEREAASLMQRLTGLGEQSIPATTSAAAG